MIPEKTRKTITAELVEQTFPLRRPRMLADCAAIGARRYRRQRDLPGAVPGLLAGDEAAILPRLIAEEQRCEQARRERTAGYRPAQHVQILSALLAEAAAACPALAQAAGAPRPAAVESATAGEVHAEAPRFRPAPRTRGALKIDARQVAAREIARIEMVAREMAHSELTCGETARGEMVRPLRPSAALARQANASGSEAFRSAI